MGIDNASVAAIITSKSQWIAQSANTLRQTQWASAASAAQNEKEQAEYEKIAGAHIFKLVNNGETITLSEEDNEVSPFQSVIEGGMSAPLSGGSGGTATNPDGSTYTSAVPWQLQGVPLPEYAKAPNPISEGITTMLQTLVPNWISEAAGECSKEIGALVKDEIVNAIQQL